MTGTKGRDGILLGDNSDTAVGGEGNDFLYGFGGNDLLYGGADRDFLSSGGSDPVTVQNADSLYGGAQRDTLFISTPSGEGLAQLSYSGAMFDGGSGSDVLEFASTSAVIDITGAVVAGIETLRFATTSAFGVRLSAAQADGISNYTLDSGFLAFADDGDVALTGQVHLSQIRLAEDGQLLDLAGARRMLSTFLGTGCGRDRKRYGPGVVDW